MTKLEQTIYIITAIVWVISMFRCLAYLRLGGEMEHTRMSSPSTDPLPAFSIIMATHNQYEDLRRSLPRLLEQIYPNFEIIVVDVDSTDGTQDLLESLEEEHTNLHHSCTNPSGRDISMQRLALTLGARAAKNPWLIFTQADCIPVSHSWLRRMGEAILGHRSVEILLGYTRYDEDDLYTEHRVRFARIWRSMFNLALASRDHGAYCCDGTNLAYKRDLFLKHRGFASHSSLLVGATDIMVNQNSTPNNTTVCLHPEAIMEQRMPRRLKWRQERIYFQETRRHFTNTFQYRARFACSVLLHAALVSCMLTSLFIASYNLNIWAILITLFLWIQHIFLQGMMFNTTVEALDGRPMGYLRTAWFIHLIPFWEFNAWNCHLYSNKRQYRKKYI